MIKVQFLWIRWDSVDGSTGYDILRDGAKVSSTKTATTAKIGVADRVDHKWEIVAKPSGQRQSLNADWS